MAAQEESAHAKPRKTAVLALFAISMGLALLSHRRGSPWGKTLGNALESVLPVHGYAADHLGWVLVHVLLLLVAPIAIAKLVCGQTLADLGLTRGDFTWWSKIVLALLPLVLLSAFVLSRVPSVGAFYRAHASRGHQALGTFGWIASFAVYFFAWEFFFRGNLVVWLGKTLGPRKAIALHLVPFVAVHLGKPTLEIALAVPGGIALGALAFRSRSMIPAFVLHLSLATSLDLFAAQALNARALPSLAAEG